MTRIRLEQPCDVPARERLLDQCLGVGRFGKVSERLRAGRLPARGLAFVATDHGRIVGTVRLWNVTAGPQQPALLLGPLAVDPRVRNRGIGGALMRHALEAAHRRGHGAVLLVGDAAYYRRFGFAAAPAGLRLPGHYDADRFLALDLQPGALAQAHGMVAATGRGAPGAVRSLARSPQTVPHAARAA